MITDLEQLLKQERDLEFDHFDNESAWRLGCLIKDQAQRENAAIAIDITVNGQQWFAHSLAGATIDNIDWIRRKQNVVQRYQHSSWYIGQYYQQKGRSLSEASLVDEKDYAAKGGSFPIKLRQVGLVGSVSVSGLSQYEDHVLVSSCMTEFLYATAKPIVK